jgi:hypothetical protein
MNEYIANYCVVAWGDPDSLVMEVQRLIKEGWQPIGGIAVAPDGLQFFQAMVTSIHP